VLDALRHLARTGGGWRMLPNDFPPWPTVCWWFRRFVRRLLFKTIHDIALMLDRERESRKQSPPAAVVDSQSIKAPAAEKRGFDAGKKIVGRKRPIAVADGSLLMANFTTADIADSAGRATRNITKGSDEAGVSPRSGILKRSLSVAAIGAGSLSRSTSTCWRMSRSQRVSSQRAAEALLNQAVCD
jgi:transposase